MMTAPRKIDREKYAAQKPQPQQPWNAGSADVDTTSPQKLGNGDPGKIVTTFGLCISTGIFLCFILNAQT